MTNLQLFIHNISKNLRMFQYFKVLFKYFKYFL